MQTFVSLYQKDTFEMFYDIIFNPIFEPKHNNNIYSEDFNCGEVELSTNNYSQANSVIFNQSAKIDESEYLELKKRKLTYDPSNFDNTGQTVSSIIK